MSADDGDDSNESDASSVYRGTRVSNQQVRQNALQTRAALPPVQGERQDGGKAENGGLRLNTNPQTGQDYRRMLGMHGQDAPQPTVWDAVNYPRDEEFEFETFYLRYERQPEAKAVIDKPVEDTWQDGPKIKDAESSDSDSQTKFEKAVQELMSGEHTRRKPIHRLKVLDKMARLGHYGVLVIGFNDGRKLETPVGGVSADATIDDDSLFAVSSDSARAENVPDDISEPEFDDPSDVMYLAVFGEDRVIDISTNQDMTSPRFRLPESFDLQTQEDEDNDSPGSGTADKYDSKNVHWSRAIHAPEGTLEDDLEGIPALKPIFHELLNIDKIRAASGEGYWRAGYQGLHVSPPQDAQGQFMEFENDGEDVATEIREFIENFDRTLATPANIETLENSVSEPNPHLDANYEAIAAATDIPKSILSGEDRADTADATDLTKYERLIAGRRNNYATPRIVKPFIQRLIDTGVLPEPEGDGFEIHWPDLEELTETQEWNLKLTKANAIRNVSPGGDTSMFATVPELRKVMGFPVNVGGSVDDDKLEGTQEDEMPKRQPLGQSAAGQSQGGAPQTSDSSSGDGSTDGASESEGTDTGQSEQTSDESEQQAADGASDGTEDDGERVVTEEGGGPTMDSIDSDTYEFAEETYNRPVEAENRAKELGMPPTYHVELIDGEPKYIPGPGPDELREALPEEERENVRPQREPRNSMDIEFQ